MTGPETVTLAAFRQETNERFDALEQAMAPAILLAARFAVAGEILAGTAKFIKWGAGTGAGIGTILLVLRAFGAV